MPADLQVLMKTQGQSLEGAAAENEISIPLINATKRGGAGKKRGGAGKKGGGAGKKRRKETSEAQMTFNRRKSAQMASFTQEAAPPVTQVAATQVAAPPVTQVAATQVAAPPVIQVAATQVAAATILSSLQGAVVSPPGTQQVVSPPVTPSCTLRLKLNELHGRLTSRLQKCNEMLVSLHVPDATKTRSLQSGIAEARKVVDVEAGALLELCANGAAEDDKDDSMMCSQYGTTTANVRKIQRCCACDANPICNLLLPCLHGVCHGAKCTSLEKCPLCGDTQPLERIAKLHIYID